MKKFNKSKYTVWYYSVVTRAQNESRKKNKLIYYERHHIVPKSIGGSNLKDNLVLLTAKEHYICHLLLPKMCINTNDTRKMARAFFYMQNGANKKRYTSRLYEYVKKSNSRLISEAYKGKNSCWYGVKKSDEHIRKISETRKKLGLSKGENNPMYGKNHSRESIKKMSVNRKGKTIGKKNGMYGKKRPDLTKRNTENNIRYKVGQYDVEGNLLAVHPHAKVAAEAIGAKTHQNINYLAKNYDAFPNRTAYGYRWKYVT